MFSSNYMPTQNSLPTSPNQSNFSPTFTAISDTTMNRRIAREPPKEIRPAMSMRTKPGENQPRSNRNEPVPDLTDFMNDWFTGAAKPERINMYNLTGSEFDSDDDDEDEGRFGKNNNSKATNEWLEEAKRLVASSPSRHDSPSRLVGSPRFVAVSRSEGFMPDRRDPMSRSARRHRPTVSFSGEILSKSAKHTRNRSDSFEPAIATTTASTTEISPAHAIHQWFSNILKPNTPAEQPPHPEPPENQHGDQNQARPPRLPVPRKSRFQNKPPDTQPAFTAIPVRRTFKNPATERENEVLSPPKNLLESAHRRSISSSTCSLDKLPRSDADEVEVPTKQVADSNPSEGVGRLNLFLKEQRAKIARISKGESSAKAKIVLSGTSNSTSSIVAAICYAWLLENRESENEEDEGWWVVVPVINMKRRRMWKQKQAAWLLHHAGIDANALLFSDEVDLEGLLMARQLSILVIGQDVLKTNGEVGSQCTILTDNYCEAAYELLQTFYLKKLLLAGILLDTHNLNTAAKLFMNRDAEAVQLLLVGSSSNYRYALFDQLMNEQLDNSFLEALRNNYGEPPVEGDDENRGIQESRHSARNSTSSSHQEINMQTADLMPGDVRNAKSKVVSPKSAKQKPPPAAALAAAPVAAPVPKPKPAPTPAAKSAPEPASRGKNKFSLAKFFGFGPK